MKKLGLSFVAIVVSSMLVACGGGGGGGGEEAPVAASADVTAAVSSGTVAALAGEAFTFDAGVAKFGTTAPTTVTLNTATTFSVAAGGNTASGTLGFGSCIFTVTASTFVPPSPLAVGSTVTVHPCSLKVATAGVVATENATARAVSFILEGNASVAKDLVVDVTPTGTVTVKGVAVGTVTLAPVTGGS